MNQASLFGLVVLTTDETAAELGKHRATVVRWVGAGRITPLRQLPGPLGGYLFTLEEVDRVRNSLAAAAA